MATSRLNNPNRLSAPSSLIMFVGVKIFRQPGLRFYLLTWQFNYLDSTSFLYAVQFGNIVCFKFRSITVLCYMYAFQALGSCGWHFLVVDFVK